MYLSGRSRVVGSLSVACCIRDVGYSGFFFQAEDGIRDLVRSRGLGDVYKRQSQGSKDKAGGRCHRPHKCSCIFRRLDLRCEAEDLSLIHI